MTSLIFTPSLFKISTMDGLHSIDLSKECQIKTPLSVEVDANVYQVKVDNAQYVAGDKVNPNDTLNPHYFNLGIRHVHLELTLTNKGAAEFSYFFRQNFRHDSLKLEISRLDIFANGDNVYGFGTNKEDDLVGHEARGGFHSFEVKLTGLERPRRINNSEWEYKPTFVRIGAI
jgi:hypothetical protein